MRSADVIIMVAPNGARKTKSSHPRLPVSIEETASEAARCQAAGACALHAHVRGVNGEHRLDAGLYGELIAEVSRRAPGMLVQITSEAVGIYTPAQQVACIRALKPEMASMALREISSNFEQPAAARRFFEWCDGNRVHIQHILYSAEDFAHFLDYRERGIIPAAQRCVLFVLGRYNAAFQSRPADLEPFLQRNPGGLDWFACAFGEQEEECIMAAIEAGGNARVGFENNLYLPGGELAPDSAALVASLVTRLERHNLAAAGPSAARQSLGIRKA